MTEIDQLKFDEKGLIPAVIVEAGTHRLLMVAYMNRESLKISMETGKPVSGAGPAKSCGPKGRPAAITSTS